jgi:hypothetical protein
VAIIPNGLIAIAATTVIILIIAILFITTTVSDVIATATTIVVAIAAIREIVLEAIIVRLPLSLIWVILVHQLHFFHHQLSSLVVEPR